MKTLFVNRHALSWAAGPQSAYIPVPPGQRVLLTRPYGGGLEGWSLEEFPDVVVCDMIDPDRLRSIARWLVENRGVRQVCAIHEKDMLLAAKLREEFGLRGMTVAETMPFRDKVLMKQTLNAAGYEQTPRYLPLRAFTKTEDLPWSGASVVKSRWGLGASEVHVVTSNVAVRNTIRTLNSAVDQLEIEEFIAGKMYHCDSIVQNGLIVFAAASEYLQAPGNFRSELYQGSVILRDGHIREGLLRHNREVLSALELRDGVTHVEFFQTADGRFVFCEAAARPGGGGIDEIVKRTYGVNLVEAAIRVQTNLDPMTRPAVETPRNLHGVVGVFQNVASEHIGEKLAAAVPGIVDYRHIEQQLPGPVRHATDYGHRVVLQARSRTEFDKRLARVLTVVSEVAAECGVQC